MKPGSREGAADGVAPHEQRRTWMILGIILLVGLVLRAGYLLELRNAPDYAAPTADAGFHDYWARGLVTGDWTPPAGVPDPTIPEVPYLRPPGYPYFLAATYAVLGDSYLVPRLVQMLLGLVNCVLVFLLGRALFGRIVALIAAGFCATYWAFIYFEGELQPPVLIITLSLAALSTLHAWRERSAFWKILAAGVLLGLLAVVRANALAFLPVAAIWTWLVARKQLGRAALGHAGLLVLGAILAIAPVTLRNKVVAGEAVLISCNGPINLHIGNNENSDGVSAELPELSTKHRLAGWSWFAYPKIVRDLAADGVKSFSDASSYYTSKALDFIRKNPGRFIGLCLTRAALFWGPAEISNNKAIAAEKDASVTLRFLPPFYLALALAIVGLGVLVCDVRARRLEQVPAPMLWLIGLFVLTYFASFVPFLAAARFRVPVIPLLLVFAAYGSWRVAQGVAQQSWKLVGAATGSATALCLALILIGRSTTRAGVDRAWWHTDRGAALLAQGKPEAAVGELRKALAESPGYIAAERHLIEAYARLGRVDDALALTGELVRSLPDESEFRLRLVRLLLQRRKGPDVANAVTELRALIAKDPSLAEAHYLLALTFENTRQTGPAIEAYRRADDEYARVLARDPQNAFARDRRLRSLIALGVLLASTGRHDDAIAAYRKAIGVDPNSPPPRANLAMALAAEASQTKNMALLDEAIDQLGMAIRLSPQPDARMAQSLERMKQLRAGKK